MHVEQTVVSSAAEVQAATFAAAAARQPNFVLVFASPKLFSEDLYGVLRLAFADAVLAGCTTAGEISGNGIGEGTAVITSVQFDSGAPLAVSTPFAGLDDSADAGRRLGEALQVRLGDTPCPAVLLLGQGVNINGSAVVSGLAEKLPAGTPIVGGLAGDDGAFKTTGVLTDGGIADDVLLAVALPPGVQIGHGSFGGWSPFGPARKVTRASGNVLYELDGEPALAVYKRYLGEYARDLPASGLLFPFEMLGADHHSSGLIRTILGVDEAAGSLTLAGDILEDGFLRLMHASTDALIDGAEKAAEAAASMSGTPAGDTSRHLSILISCIGRKLVMGARTDEEVEAVGETFGQKSTLTGFYSYGEISPFLNTTECKLHNQTMTVTCLSEAST